MKNNLDQIEQLARLSASYQVYSEIYNMCLASHDVNIIIRHCSTMIDAFSKQVEKLAEERKSLSEQVKKLKEEREKNNN